MDRRDLEILMAISELGTTSPEQIENETGVPKSTVHYRLQNLKESGVILNDLCDLDLEAIGLDVTVITEVTADYSEGYHDQVGDKLSGVEGVNQVYFTMGDTDFIVIANLADRSMVEDLVGEYERIEEIERTSSRFAISTIKDEPKRLQHYDIETLVENLLLE